MANLEEIKEEAQVTADDETVEIVVEEAQKAEKINKNKTKRPSKIKGAFSELKKVTWPGFGKIMKQMAVVLTVTLMFLVVIMGIDYLLSLFNGWLI